MSGSSTTFALNAKHRKCIMALAGGTSIADAALAAGVTERTVYKWRANPGFLSALREADSGNLQEISRRLTEETNDALDVLEEIMNKEDTPDSVKVRAASEILKHRAAFYELTSLQDTLDEILERLSEGGL